MILWVLRSVKGHNIAQNDKKLSVTPYISGGTIHHMIFINGTHLKKYNVSRYFLPFFWILIFGVNSGVKGQEMAQNDKKLSVAFHISGSIYHMIMIFDFDCTNVKWWDLHLGGSEGWVKGEKWPIITNFSLSHSISQEL